MLGLMPEKPVNQCKNIVILSSNWTSDSGNCYCQPSPLNLWWLPILIKPITSKQKLTHSIISFNFFQKVILLKITNTLLLQFYNLSILSINNSHVFTSSCIKSGVTSHPFTYIKKKKGISFFNKHIIQQWVHSRFRYRSTQPSCCSFLTPQMHVILLLKYTYRYK